MQGEKRDILEGLVKEYGALVFSVCYRLTGDYFYAEDLAQDTFLSALCALDGFDNKNPKAWLTKIATGKCLDYLKSSAAKTAPTEDSELENSGGVSVSLEDEVFKELMISDIRSACEALKKPYREVALDYYINDKPLTQIAEENGEKLKTIQTKAYRARLMLQKKLREVI